MTRSNLGAALAVALSLTALLSFAGAGAAHAAHEGFTWQGNQDCMTCHETETRDAHGSGHYQWQGPALYTVNGPDMQGKLNTAFNSYCVAILGNWNACGSCHVGLGAKPEANATAAQLQNVDCLICHQKDYKRKKVDGVFVPDTANMTVTMDQAIQTVHKPVRANCVQCHAKGGGGDNNKRGDMALAHAVTTDRNFDVHMATAGANLTCQQCHTTQNHKIAGRGSDLRQTDLDVEMSCSTAACHPTKATATGHASADVNRHVQRVACQTCHISTYARNAADTAATESTEVDRDWTVPEFSAALNRWEPTVTRGSNLKPAYTFWNGYSWNYSLNEPAWLDDITGAYGTSRPEGGINDPGSMLYPFKYKKALQPLADSLGVLVALDTAVYFSTGNYDNAVKAGLTNMGHPAATPYSNVETDTYQLITHEVMPRANALSCAQCHTASATQMNLETMGYTMKGTEATTCRQCHGQESMPSYTSLHKKHVADKKYDCSWCHDFSRPERGLKMAPGVDTTPPTVTAFVIPESADSLTVAITALAATDNVGVNAYLLTESPTRPSGTTGSWSSIVPTSYTFATAGTKTLYAWARDAAGNVSQQGFAGAVVINSSQQAVEILWRNNASGNNVVWLMNGAEMTGSSSLPSVPDVDWTIVGLGDFNGDTRRDILWRNTSSGENIVWQMNGTALAGSVSIPAVADTNWTIAGAGDFNADGKSDILWRNRSSGQNVVWTMDGSAYSGSVALPTVGDTNWSIVGVDDFNDDGRGDILWRNTSSGENILWYMNGAALSSSVAIPMVADTSWSIVGVDDINGDSWKDILWRNTSSGQNVVWHMNGAAFSGAVSIPTVADTSWDIVD